jgi:hypothetical protein
MDGLAQASGVFVHLFNLKTKQTIARIPCDDIVRDVLFVPNSDKLIIVYRDKISIATFTPLLELKNYLRPQIGRT